MNFHKTIKDTSIFLLLVDILVIFTNTSTSNMILSQLVIAVWIYPAMLMKYDKLNIQYFSTIRTLLIGVVIIPIIIISMISTLFVGTNTYADYLITITILLITTNLLVFIIGQLKRMKKVLHHHVQTVRINNEKRTVILIRYNKKLLALVPDYKISTRSIASIYTYSTVYVATKLNTGEYIFKETKSKKIIDVLSTAYKLIVVGKNIYYVPDTNITDVLQANFYNIKNIYLQTKKQLNKLSKMSSDKLDKKFNRKKQYAK